MKSKTINILVFILLCVIAVAFLISAALDNRWVETISVNTYLAERGSYNARRVQIYGKVVPGSVKQNNNRVGVEFQIYDISAKSTEQAKRLPIGFAGRMPPNIGNDTEVLVNCRIDAEGNLTVEKVFTKCPSKYKQKLRGAEEY